MARRNRLGSIGCLAMAMATLAAVGPEARAAEITAYFDSSIDSADQTTIEDALMFYDQNMTSDVNVTVAFSTQDAGGAGSVKFINTVSYSSYYNDLVSVGSDDATDNSAIASLGSCSGACTNPVTGSSSVTLTNTLASLLDLATAATSHWTGTAGDSFVCNSEVATNACITIGTDELGEPGLSGVVQHEMDEVFGTSSNLPNGGTGGLPTNPSAADLFRYAAPGVRSFALNPDTDQNCQSPSPAPVAYFSINGGTKDLSDYNNCNNGGDYGDWNSFLNGEAQVQDAYGDPDTATSLTLASPEVTLLDAVGYNFASEPTPEPAAWELLAVGLAAFAVLSRKRTRVSSVQDIESVVVRPEHR